jgi:hypothetical protein
MPFAVFFKSMPLDEVIFLLRGRLVLAPCVPFIEHEFSVIDEFLGVVEGSPAEFHGHDPISLSHSGCALLPRVRGEHVLARAAPAECRASRLRIKCSPGEQWARDPTRDALTPVKFPKRFSSLPNKDPWFDTATNQWIDGVCGTLTVPAPLEHDPEKLQTFRIRSCEPNKYLERNRGSI